MPTSWPTPSPASKRRGITVLLSGVQPGHERVLRELGVYSGLAHERHLFDTTPAAIAHARLHASRIAHAPTDTGTDPVASAAT